MRLARCAVVVIGLVLLTGCETTMMGTLPDCTLQAGVTTVPMHDPIYPAGGPAGGGTRESVTYRLTVSYAPATLATVNLEERVESVDAAGNTTVISDWAQLSTWTAPIPTCPGDASKLCVQHSISGHDTDRLIRYRFKLLDDAGVELRVHEVAYATKPYPPSTVTADEAKQPAPVYAQGALGQVMDVAFMRDVNNTVSDSTFHGHVRGMIEDSLYHDERVKFWAKQFNFYINPLTATAQEYPDDHLPPVNAANLTAFEGRAILHDYAASPSDPTTGFRDHTTGDGWFSTEQWHRGTMLHEAGHGLFGLKDEYEGGAHLEVASLPNNWQNRNEAKAAAASRCKDSKDVDPLHKNSWFKMCAVDSQMNQSGEDPTPMGYDLPCEQRVEDVITQASGQ